MASSDLRGLWRIREDYSDAVSAASEGTLAVVGADRNLRRISFPDIMVTVESSTLMSLAEDDFRHALETSASFQRSDCFART